MEIYTAFIMIKIKDYVWYDWYNWKHLRTLMHV